MADISKIKLLNGDVYDVKDNSAVANITRDGTTFTATKRDGSTFTFTQQDNDTKNTAGSTDTSSKIFLIGATSQADNPQTYSDDEIFATNGVLSAKGFTAMRTLTAVTSGKGDLGASATPRYIPYLWYGSFDHDPVDGEIIIIKMPSAGNTAGIYLSINGNDTTKYHPIAIGTTTRLTTQYASGNMLMLVYQANQTVTTYPIAGANSTSSSAAGIWRVLNYYDSNTNTLLRVYSSATNINVPLIGQSSANSTTASWSSYTSTYKDWYGAIPNDDAKRAKINLSTGAMTVPGGITANLIGNVTGNADTATNVTWSGVTDKPSEFTPSSHTHGNITNAGAITATQSIATGDALVIVDSSDSSKLTGTTIAFDGSTANKALTQKGTWEAIGTKALKIASNTGTTTQAVALNENSSDRTLTVKGDGTYLTGAVSGSSNAVTVTISHKDPVAVDGSKLTASASGATAAWSIDVVKGITVNRDAKGHVTGISVTSGKIPANPNTDTLVKQTLMANTENVEYKLLTTTSASPTSGTAYEAKYGANLAYNPSTNKLSTGNLKLTGTLEVTGQTTLNDNLNAQGITATNLQVSGATNFVQSPTAPTPAAGDASTKLATTEFVTGAVTDLAGPMRFIGSLGTGGTATTLPAAAAANKGHTYKVITAGTYQSVAAKVGDLLISNGSSWVLIPSGDEPVGTVTNIATGSGLTGGPITDSGTISHADTSTQVSITANGRKYITGVTLDDFGHVTGLTTGTETVVDTDSYVNSAAFANDDTNNNVKMTLTRTGTVTGTVTANIPKVSSSSAGVAPKGAAVSEQSQSTKFLREDGTWAAPSYTSNTDTKVTQNTTTAETWRKVLLNGGSSNTYSTWNADVVNQTDVVYQSKSIAVQPSTGTLQATALQAGTYNSSIRMYQIKAWGKTGPYEAGWKRVCALSGYNGYGVGTVYINGSWSNEEPTLAAFEIAFSHTSYAHIKQTMGARKTTPDQVRLVYSGTGGKWYFDIHIPARAASTNTGARYITFVGRLTASEIDETTNLLAEEPTTTTVTRTLVVTNDQPTITVNLASTTAGSFTGANMTTGISGTLPLDNGGTGATDQAGAFTNIVAPGGEMIGPLTWKNSTALPAITSPEYILAIDSFANGGTTTYVTTANLATAVDSSHKWVRIDGDTMTGTLNIDRSDTTGSAILNLKSNRGTLWIGSEGTGDSTPIQGFWLHSTKENSVDSGLYWNDDNYIAGISKFATDLLPSTKNARNIGSASLRWNYGYFRNLYISDDENYTASTSATNGITLSGIGGWIDLTSPDTSTTPHIDFKLNKSALDYQVRLESDSPGRITIKRDTTNVTTSKADPNKAANITYNNRSIDPVFQVTGIAHFSSAINAATYLFNNSAAGGDNTGYYLAANNVASGRLYIATRGLASVSDGADPPIYTDTPGRVVLQLGNAREGRPTIGVDDNAAGWLRLYGEGIRFHDIRPSTAVRHQVSYLPQYYTGTSSSSSTYYYGRLAAIYKGTTAGEDGFSDVGSISQPVYVTKEGIIKATDSFMRYYSISAYYNATSRSWKKVATLSVDALPKLTGGSSAWIILQFFNGTTYDTIPMGTLRALVYRKDTDTSGVTTDTAITLKLDWIDCNLEGNFENYKLVYTLTDNPTVEDSGNKDLTADLWVKVNKNYEAIICKELAEGKWSVNYPLGTFWTLSDNASATGTTVAKAAGFTTDPAAAGAPNAITSTYFIEKGAAGYLTYYSSNKTLAKTSFAHFNWKTGTTAEDGYEELVLGNSANSGTDNNAFGRLAMYSSGTKGTYIVPANNTTTWYTATLQAKTGTIALTSDITTAIQTLDVSSVGNTNGSKYIAAISEADGKISATAVNVATTYSASGTTAISGTGVAAALGTLDVAAVGGGTGEYISQISEIDGKISATKTTTSVSNAWEGGTDAGPKIKTTVNGITGTAVAIPHATNAVSGVVTTTTQTFAGAKTFANNVTISGTSTHTGAATFNATGNSTHSKDTNAAVVVKGGVSVEKQISARTVRVDGTSTDNSNTTPGGVSLQYDSTLQVLNFVFS